MKKSKNENLEQIGTFLAMVAQDNGVHPQEVTKAQVLAKGLEEWQIRKVGGLQAVKDYFFPYTEKDLKTTQTLKNSKTYTSKLEKELGNKLITDETMFNVFSQLKLPKFQLYKVRGNKKIERAVNLVLSDLHFGSDISSKNTGGLDFGKTEEARRIARITKEVCDYKPQYRNHTELNVLLLGDIIQNQLHDARDGAPLAEQICRAIHLLSQSLMHFCQHFPKVNVKCTGGNHSRNTSRHHNRAVNGKWDNFETVIYFALKDSFKGVNNINFDIPLTPYVTYEVFGKKIFCTHGDTVLNPGYAGKSINTKSLETQINKINATLKDNEEYSTFIVGHIHTGSTTHLGNGAVMITNGALVPSDEYAVSIGLLENSCGQYLFESVPGYPVGDQRFIRVNYLDDKDSSLDKIIKPFEQL